MEPEEPPEPPALDLRPLPYHQEVVDHLRHRAPGVWRHIRSGARDPEHTEAQRLHLLKTTVVLERASHPELYQVADDVAGALALGVPVELYQGEDPGNLNAALLFLPEIARVVFYGPVQERLDREELRALLGHELAHHRLWSLDDGVHLAALHALDGIAGMAALASVGNTRRLFSLATEVFADRAALGVAGLEPTLGCLIKTRTGLSTVAPLDFLAQSRELHAAEDTGSRGWTHPEAHVRALALEWYDADGADAEPRIRRLLEGPIQLDELDLLRREELATLSERLVGALLQPAWFRTDAALGQARLMFDDYEVPPAPAPLADAEELAPWGDSVRDYLAYLLTDFVAVDPELEDLPLLQAHAVAEPLGLAERLERSVNRELRMTKKKLQESLRGRDERLRAAAERSGA